MGLYLLIFVVVCLVGWMGRRQAPPGLQGNAYDANPSFKNARTPPGLPRERVRRPASSVERVQREKTSGGG